MKPQQPGNIFNSAKIFYYILKSLGMANFTFDFKTGKLKVKILDYLRLIVTIGLLLSEFHNQAVEYSTGKVHKGMSIGSSFLDKIWQHQFMIQLLLLVMVVIVDLCRCHHIEKFMILIKDFDDTTGHIPSWPKKIVHSKWTSFYIFLSILFLLVTPFIPFFFHPKIETFFDFKFVYNHVTATLKSLMLLLLIMKFHLSIYCIRVRLEVLKDYAK